jgi:hypothetical protein
MRRRLEQFMNLVTAIFHNPVGNAKNGDTARNPDELAEQIRNEIDSVVSRVDEHIKNGAALRIQKAAR